MYYKIFVLMFVIKKKILEPNPIGNIFPTVSINLLNSSRVSYWVTWFTLQSAGIDENDHLVRKFVVLFIEYATRES